MPVRVLWDNDRGAARARNIGICEAKGEILIFLDDDVKIPGSDFISQHVRSFDNPAIGGVCGRTIELRQEMQNKGFSSLHPLVYPLICLPGGNASLDTPEFVNSVKGGNMSFRAAILRGLRGFDERFGFPCIYEETDVALKVHNSGHRIWFCPGALLYHIGAPTGGQRAGNLHMNRRFIAYRDRVLLFRNNCPLWQFPAFLVGNLLLAARPLIQLRWRDAWASCAGLMTGIRQYVF
jgi:GT2 family glycosyltransferase